MTTFVDAVLNHQETRTANDMKALTGTSNPCVDLFYKIGASRGKNIIPEFQAAYLHNREQALRIALWARDVRGGAGERQIFRDILQMLDASMQDDVRKDVLALLVKTPEVGRWDDLLSVRSIETKRFAFSLIADALCAGHGLTAKWMPRKGSVANELRTFLGLTPKQYRKYLVRLTKVVETQMCAKDWDNINFSHVPSLASARYKKAFNRHTPKYLEYVQSLIKGDDPKVKVNAAAVYPYDVLKGIIHSYGGINFNSTELGLIEKQWEALPNYMMNSNILPLIDVSGSMTVSVGGRKKSHKRLNLSYLDIAVSLGLYCADKNKGKFKDTFLTFSAEPQLLHLKGNVLQKINQMTTSNWDMNTDLHKALNVILTTAKKGKVPQKEMPNMLLIISDMQFDQCAIYDDSAYEMIKRKYTKANYEVPKIVFWNLHSYDNVPVQCDTLGTALVSGFSPAIMKSILAGTPETFTPEQVMLQTIMNPRYDLK